MKIYNYGNDYSCQNNFAAQSLSETTNKPETDATDKVQEQLSDEVGVDVDTLPTTGEATAKTKKRKKEAGAETEQPQDPDKVQ